MVYRQDQNYNSGRKNSSQLAPAAQAGGKPARFEDLTTEQQDRALERLGEECADLVGRAIARNFQAVRNQSLFHLLPDAMPGDLFDRPQ